MLTVSSNGLWNVQNGRIFLLFERNKEVRVTTREDSFLLLLQESSQDKKSPKIDFGRIEIHEQPWTPLTFIFSVEVRSLFHKSGEKIFQLDWLLYVQSFKDK